MGQLESGRADRDERITRRMRAARGPALRAWPVALAARITAPNAVTSAASTPSGRSRSARIRWFSTWGSGRDWAGITDTAVETVSRTMSALAAQGEVETLGRGRYRLVNPARLARLARLAPDSGDMDTDVDLNADAAA